ncbi:hypothetical protein HEP86_39560 [Streptomyces sp. RPA4-5]|uniref:hypothetical protein n=1 Tax=Streptomyces sp. RPA4-5 TaxID=2721245 RepID=UPI00143EA3B9|nr:hypothetical protein [Streptomyces sp. RPA4-5]QIY59432.1 hypothetical protein HEP86_39560 [Streptomyces sp. RPA4-5]
MEKNGRMARMDGEVMAALIGGASGLVGALVGGSAAVWAARHQGRLSVRGALETARSTYLGPLDTARRTAQREVFARFLTVSQEWARQAGPAAAAAEHWDRSVCDHIERLRDDSRAYVDLHDEVTHRYQRQVSAAGEPHGITEAAQHVLLEAAGTDVVRAAQDVEQHAVRLRGLLNDAGKTHLIDPDGTLPDDPTNHRPPTPSRAPAEHTALKGAIEAFARIAAAHLNKRDPGNVRDGEQRAPQCAAPR